MKKIGIIVQRYGIEVNGGAEFHARVLAEHLKQEYNVEVITNCALDYTDWKNYYQEGISFINDIKIIRFLNKKKNNKLYLKYKKIITNNTKSQKFLRKIGFAKFYKNEIKQEDCENWLKHQGPYCPDLVDYIKNNEKKYDVFIFFTYMYYPTVIGMPFVAEKSIFIPTAHDEEIMFTKPYENIFSIPKFIMFNTESEKNLVLNNFKNVSKNYDIAGVGIENTKKEVFRNLFSLQKKRYFIYIGRINELKGCKQMVEDFIKFVKNNNVNYKLVLIGRNFLKENYNHPSIIFTGFLDENTKNELLQNALVMIMPSLYESLSLVTLEAMVEKIPVIVNANCEVLLKHIKASHSGGYYYNSFEFESILKEYIHKTNNELLEEGNNAKKYVEDNYSWNSVMAKFNKAVNLITYNQ